MRLITEVTDFLNLETFKVEQRNLGGDGAW